jgi:hypothetical protein
MSRKGATTLDPSVLDRLLACVSALQAVITSEALRLAAGSGHDMATAARFLLSGSAASPFMSKLAQTEGLVGGRLPHAAWPSLGSLLQQIEDGCELAESASVPALSFAVGREVTLNAISRCGSSMNVVDAFSLEPIQTRDRN